MTLIKNKSLSFKTIASWSLYDWGVSSFAVVITTFVIATYFTSKIAVNEIIGTHQWGNTMAIGGIVVAIASPICGSIADYVGHHKFWLGVLTLSMIVCASLLWFALPEPSFALMTLTLVAVGTVSLNLARVFYNSLLLHIAPKDHIGRISGWAWGLGYFGGLTALVIAYFGFVSEKPSWLNSETYEQIRICGPLVALWIAVFTAPLFLFITNPPIAKRNPTQESPIHQGLKELLHTFKNIPKHKNIFLFLISQMIYIDGLNTIFAFGGIYAAGTFHMSLSEILLFGIFTNASAGTGSILLSWVDDWIGAKPTILISLLAIFVLGLGVVLIETKFWFWILACSLALFVGPVQSSSRSLMAQLVPKEKTTQFFGFYVLSGKMTTFIGPWMFGSMTYFFDSQRVGMGSILVFFLIGAILLFLVHPPQNLQQSHQ